MQIREKMTEVTGFFSTKFYYAFRAMFFPVTRFCRWAHISPDAITVFSMILGFIMGIFMALDRLLIAIPFGLAMSFADIVDGQLAKVYGEITPFGGILDSFIDRYNEFFVFAGLGARYYFLNRPLMMGVCALGFLGSVMISYVKARAESDGFECKVGRLQRPERLSLIGVGVLIGGLGFDAGLDGIMLFIGGFTHVTAFYRLHHVSRQARKPGSGKKS